MEIIGFIGLGTMGGVVARNIQKAGLHNKSMTYSENAGTNWNIRAVFDYLRMTTNFCAARLA